jgi:hypothetical protein
MEENEPKYESFRIESYRIMNSLCSLNNVHLDQSQILDFYTSYLNVLGPELTLKALKFIRDEGCSKFPVLGDLKKALAKSWKLKMNIPDVVHQIQLLVQSKGINGYKEARSEAQSRNILWAFDKIFNPPGYYRTFCDIVKDDQWTIYASQWNKILMSAHEEWSDRELGRCVAEQNGIEYKAPEQLTQAPKATPDPQTQDNLLGIEFMAKTTGKPIPVS